MLLFFSNTDKTNSGMSDQEELINNLASVGREEKIMTIIVITINIIQEIIRLILIRKEGIMMITTLLEGNMMITTLLEGNMMITTLLEGNMMTMNLQDSNIANLQYKLLKTEIFSRTKIIVRIKD